MVCVDIDTWMLQKTKLE